MKIVFIFIIALTFASCSKPKTVLICGDHICVNKAEADQFFRENLSLEVKIINQKIKKDFDLVELNLKEDSDGKKKVSITSKENTSGKIKTLSKKEISNIKNKLKNKKKHQKIVKKEIDLKKMKKKKKKVAKKKEKNINDNKFSTLDTKAKNKDVVDVCSIIKDCNIDEISKFLIEQGKKKDFPDITKRQ